MKIIVECSFWYYRVLEHVVHGMIISGIFCITEEMWHLFNITKQWTFTWYHIDYHSLIGDWVLEIKPNLPLFSQFNICWMMSKPFIEAFKNGCANVLYIYSNKFIVIDSWNVWTWILVNGILWQCIAGIICLNPAQNNLFLVGL